MSSVAPPCQEDQRGYQIKIKLENERKSQIYKLLQHPGSYGEEIPTKLPFDFCSSCTSSFKPV